MVKRAYVWNLKKKIKEEDTALRYHVMNGKSSKWDERLN